MVVHKTGVRLIVQLDLQRHPLARLSQIPIKVNLLAFTGPVPQVSARGWVPDSIFPDGCERVLETIPLGHVKATSDREEELSSSRRIAVLSDDIADVRHEMRILSTFVSQVLPDGALHVNACRNCRVLKLADVSGWKIEKKPTTEVDRKEGKNLRTVFL